METFIHKYWLRDPLTYVGTRVDKKRMHDKRKSTSTDIVIIL